MKRERERETERETDRQTDIQRETERERQTDRQTESGAALAISCCPRGSVNVGRVKMISEVPRRPPTGPGGISCVRGVSRAHPGSSFASTTDHRRGPASVHTVPGYLAQGRHGRTWHRADTEDLDTGAMSSDDAWTVAFRRFGFFFAA